MTRTAILLVALFLPACLEPQEVDELPPGAEAVPSSQLAALDPFRIYGGITTRERGVVRDPGDWNSAWIRLVGTFEPKPPTPAIDFERDMVVVAAMGARPTGGYGIRIEGVYRAGDRLYVVVEERSPGPNCLTTQAFTAPVAAVRIARTSLPVSFVNRTSVTNCD